jgi:putative chitinase
MSVVTSRRPKSIFRSLGFMSGAMAVLVGFAQFLFTPEGFDRAATCLDTFGQNHTAETVRSLTPLLVILLGASGSFGRYRAGGLRLRLRSNKPAPPSRRRAQGFEVVDGRWGGTSEISALQTPAVRQVRIIQLEKSESGRGGTMTSNQSIDPAVVERVADSVAARIKALSPSDPKHGAVDDFVRFLAGFPKRGGDRPPYEGLLGQAATESTPRKFDANVPINWGDFRAHITQNFTVGEYLCYDAARVPKSVEVKKAAIAICQELELIRSEWGSGIIITSGYRPPAINDAVGGVYNSQHINGHAVDIAPVDPHEIHKFQVWLDPRWAGAFGYGADRGFVHIDMRNGKGFDPNDQDPGPRWDY